MCFSVYRNEFNIQTLRNYTTKYAKQTPARQSIRNWHKQFMETGTVLHKQRSASRSTSEEDNECTGQSTDGNRSGRDSSTSESSRLKHRLNSLLLQPKDS